MNNINDLMSKLEERQNNLTKLNNEMAQLVHNGTAHEERKNYIAQIKNELEQIYKLSEEIENY